jgi:hypothetical protein
MYLFREEIMIVKFILALLLNGLFIINVNSGDYSGPYEVEFEWQKKISNKEDKNILDYFYILPSEFIDCEGASFNEYDSFKKRSMIKPIVNKDKSYLSFYRTSEMSVFKRKLGGDVIAIQSGRCGAGNTCGSINSTYVFDKGVWSEVVSVLPDDLINIFKEYPDDICPYIDLSKGKNSLILMNELSNEPIKIFNWNGELFK